MSQPGTTPEATTTASAAPKCVEVAIAVVFGAAASGEADGVGGKLLICKRQPHTVLGGYWEFPGGKCDARELPAACAAREVEEETGLRVRVLGALAPIEHTYPHARVRLHPFVCEVIGGALECRAVAEARWIAAGEVTGYQFPEANGPLLEQIRLGREAVMGNARRVAGIESEHC